MAAKLSTPKGKVKPSDEQLIYRYKWSARKSKIMYKTQGVYLCSLQSQLLDIIGEITGSWYNSSVK